MMLYDAVGCLIYILAVYGLLVLIPQYCRIDTLPGERPAAEGQDHTARAECGGTY